MRIYILALGVFILPTIASFGQKITFGPTIANVWQNQSGTTRVDSVLVEVIGTVDDRMSLGAFVTYEINDFLSLNLSADNWYESAQFRLTNTLERCSLCPITGGVSTRFLKSQIALSGHLWLPVQIPYTRVFAIGGLTGDVSWLEDDYESFIMELDDLSLQLRQVGDQLVDLNKPFHTSYLIGLGVDVWNFTLQGTFRSSLGNEYFKPLHYQGTTYRIAGESNYLLLTLGYQFKIPPKDEE